MKKLISITVALLSVTAVAFDSEMTLTHAELLTNSTIARGSAGSGDETSRLGSRILQLQLGATLCNRVIIVPDHIMAAPAYKYSIMSENCKIVAKGSKCGPGFSLRKMEVNPNKRDSVIIGLEKYEVCLQNPAGAEQATPAK